MDNGEAIEKYVTDLLNKPQPYTSVSANLFKELGADIVLPDGGETVRLLADQAPGGTFDPRDLEKISPTTLGYKAKWITFRYDYYGLDWDITALRLESLHSQAQNLPWIVIIHGGSANFYEFFLDPLNNPGLGQYLAQRVNVLLVTIPGNFKYGGWTLPTSERCPQYLLDKDLSPDEGMVRNTIYTNKLVIEGLKRIILQEGIEDILILGHAQSGELVFLSMSETELAERLKGRFLGWGSGGPSNLFKEWEIKIGRRASMVKELSKYPPIWQLRSRNTEGYVRFNYVGPLNPCGEPGMKELDVGRRWFSLEERRRPNFKQVMLDIEHHGMDELHQKIEAEMKEILAKTKLPIKEENVLKDMYAVHHAPLTGYKRMVWVVGKWDSQHWDKSNVKKARELTVANQFRERNPWVPIRVLLFDLPLTMFGHIEMPCQVAGGLIAAIYWLC